MKSIYDDFDFDDDTGKDGKKTDAARKVPAPEQDAPAADAPAPEPEAPAAEPETPAADTAAPAVDPPVMESAAPVRSRITGIVTLALLIAVIGLQVTIVGWQRSINGALKRLQEEVNLEKQQRIELGSDLLKRIDGVMQEKVAAPATAAAPAPAGNTVYMTTAKVNVRSAKSAKSRQMTKLKRGGVVTEVEKDGTWTKIDYGSGSGWVLGKYLSVISAVKVKASKLSVRSEPTSKGKILGKVKRNARGTVLDYRDKYYKAAFGEVTGWVHRKYVRGLK